MAERFGRDWWPDGVRYPAARLAGGLAAGALCAAALATLATVAVGGMMGGAPMGPPPAQVFLSAISGFMVFAATFGFAAMLGLWSARRRDVKAFAATGAACGVVFTFATALLFGAPPSPTLPIVMGAAGALVLLVARWAAGIRPR